MDARREGQCLEYLRFITLESVEFTFSIIWPYTAWSWFSAVHQEFSQMAKMEYICQGYIKISDITQRHMQLPFLWLGLHISITYLDFINKTYSLKACASPITALGCHQCLSLCVVQLKCKHCRRPIPVMGLAHAFQHCQLTLFIGKQNKENLEFWPCGLDNVN